MNQEVRGLVLTQECRLLEEAIKYATRYQECFERNIGDRIDFVRKINYNRTFFPTKKGRGSFRPWKFDTSKKKAEFTKRIPEWNRKRVDPRDNRSKTIKCYKCGRSGHVIKDCRVSKGGAVHKVNQLIADEKIERVLTVTKKDMPSILRTEGYVNEIKLKFSFDIGATASIIAYDVEERNNFKILPSEVKVKTADNTVSEAIGVTELMTVEIQGHICKLRFLIMDHEDHKVLLDWFIATGAGLFPAKRVLKFSGQKIILDNDETWSIDDMDQKAMIAEVVDSEDITNSGWDDWTDEKNKGEIKPVEIFSEQQADKLEKTMKSVRELFAYEIKDLKTCLVVKHKIRIEDVPPIFSPPYRKSIKEREILKEEVAEMIRVGI
jgi:hypothetical protein